MRRQLFLLIAAVLLLAGFSAQAAEPFMPRYPAISPDGSTILFSFQGDLWSVSSEGGQATRLTVHKAYDSHPVFSPDGKTIAFASDRYGDNDVYIMPATGGTPTRLTYAASGDEPYAFSPDGSTVYFASRRLFDFPMGDQIYKVSVEGGTPTRLADMFGDEVAVGPDGNTFVIAEGRMKFGRKHYRGTYQRDLYTWTPGQDPVKVSDHNGVDTQPMVGPDGTIYWVNDAAPAMTRNLWKMNADGSGKTRLTSFEGDGVRWAGLAGDGSRFVLEVGTRLYTLANREGAEPMPLGIQVAADMLDNPVTVETKHGDADEVELSTNGEEVALVVEGEIVLVNKELGGRSTVAVPGPSREQEIMWRPGSTDSLLFVTDRFGRRQIALLLSDDEDESDLRKARRHRIEQLTDGDEPSFRPVWSPKGDRFAFVRGLGDIVIMDADGGGERVLSEHWDQPQMSWSPDGRWLAVARSDRNYNTDVWIFDADGKRDPVNVSQHPDDDMLPVWSANGQQLAWSTRRHGNQYDIYAVYLTRKDHERTREEWEVWEKTRDKKKGDGEEKEGDKVEELVEIDFEDIHLRARRLTGLPGDEFAVGIHPKGDRIFFTATVSEDNDIYSVDRFGDDLTAVTTGGTRPSGTHLHNATNQLVFLQRGRPGFVGLEGGKVESTDFAARITIDRPARRLQVLDEGWRFLNDRFYDPNHHGVDWAAKRTKYAEWVKHVRHDRDFADVVNLMLGEINASHMGYYPRGGDDDAPKDGFLGLEFDPSYDGEGLKVARVLPYGPADKAEFSVESGDILLTVDDKPVSSSQNYFRTLEGRRDLPTWVTLKRGRDELEAELVPVSGRDIWQLNYEQMERANRSHVEDRTDGRIGYVHIQGMSMPEVERFEMNLYANADDKEALIIDVRNNGGGWTTDMLLTILTQPVHAYTIGRDGEVGYPQPRYPLYRWSRPITVICNAGSYSNAEIFSHAIKTNGRGPVVGETTGGNVISTGGWTTLDGNWIRLPFRGWYVWGDEQHPERNHKNQEQPYGGKGAVPDYEVPLTPADRLADRDPQLDKAIELMLQAADEAKTEPHPSERFEKKLSNPTPPQELK